jgi:hypothetical protein
MQRNTSRLSRRSPKGKAIEKNVPLLDLAVFLIPHYYALVSVTDTDSQQVLLVTAKE